jgi:hypothetical protein
MKQPLPTIDAAPPRAGSRRAVMPGSPPGPTPHAPGHWVTGRLAAAFPPTPRTARAISRTGATPPAHGPHRTPAQFVRLAPGTARIPQGATIHSHKSATTGEHLDPSHAQRGLRHFPRHAPAHPFFCRSSWIPKLPTANKRVDVASHNSCFTVAFSVAPPGLPSFFLRHGEGSKNPPSSKPPVFKAAILAPPLQSVARAPRALPSASTGTGRLIQHAAAPWQRRVHEQSRQNDIPRATSGGLPLVGRVAPWYLEHAALFRPCHRPRAGFGSLGSWICRRGFSKSRYGGEFPVISLLRQE